MRLASCNQTYSGNKQLISATHFWSTLQLWILTTGEKKKKKYLYQLHMFLDLIFLHYFSDTLSQPQLISGWFRNTQDLLASLLVLLLFRFVPFVATYPVIHVRILFLFLMLSEAYGLLNQHRRQWGFFPISYTIFCRLSRSPQTVVEEIIR